MKNLTLNNIANACGGVLKGATGNAYTREVTSVVIDSRKVTEGGLFIATKGERVDGHSFIADVAAKGVLAVVCERDIDTPIPYILVEDSFKALKDIARFYRMQLSIPVIGITGSVGKTSTKEFIAGTLGVKYNVCKTQGNFNNEIGLPLTVLSIKEEHDIAVIEMGISDFGEMSRLSDIAKPDTCVITNIGQCHLEQLGDRDGVLRAKTECFYYMNHDGAIFLNGDDDKLKGLKAPWNRSISYYGLLDREGIYPTEVTDNGLFGSEAVFHIGDESFHVNIKRPGIHMLYNALAAAGVAKEYGLTNEEIIKGLDSVEATSGRSNVFKAGELTLIDDCYNANPVSTKAAIDLLNRAQSRKVAILGDMFELGADEKALHFEVGNYAASAGIDIIVAVGALAENLYQGAKEADIVAECIYYKDVDECISNISSILKAEDSVLIKASRGMHFEKIVEALSDTNVIK